VAALKNTIEETKSICEELQKQCASLQEALKTVEAEKMVGDLCFWLNTILLLLSCVTLSFIKNVGCPEVSRR
jgi:hypothetical protein